MKASASLARVASALSILAALAVAVAGCDIAKASLPTASTPLPEIGGQQSTPTGFGSVLPAATRTGFIGRFDFSPVDGFPSRFRGRAVSAAVPASPSGLTASVSGPTVTLSWHAPIGGGTAGGYIIEAGSSQGAADLANFSTGSAATTFTTGDVPAGTYFVRVRAVNADGIGAPSSDVVVTVGEGGTCLPPTGLAVTANSGGTVVLTWNAPADGAPSYWIDVGSTAGASDLLTQELGSPATTMTATGVPGGTYFVRVRARNRCGTSAASNEVRLVVVNDTSNPASYDGAWSGTTSQGRPISFIVENNQIKQLVFGYDIFGNTGVYPVPAPFIAISGGAVNAHFAGNPDLTFTATFTSATSVSGGLTLVLTPVPFVIPFGGTFNFTWSATR